jgi:two-component system nitrogen regulation response regulator GlnG
MQPDEPFQGVRDCVAPTPYQPTPTPGVRRAIDDRMGIVGRSEAMHALRERIVRFARATETVLIRGETGTGKELVARALHTHSSRAQRLFVAANVAALPSSMLLSELFGHERGAFTGAYLRHKGLFEQAHGGTLFLDEVGELDAEAQAALLRVLETREVRPVGAESTRRVDVRLLAATHRNLSQMVRTGAFREDLFYRLNLLVIEVPALRHRISDVVPIARHVLARLAPERGVRQLDESATKALTDYAWPGNVRQLENVLRRMVVTFDEDAFASAHVHVALSHEQDAAELCREAATTATVLTLLAAENGNITRTARRLGIARSTVRAHLRRAGRTNAA